MANDFKPTYPNNDTSPVPGPLTEQSPANYQISTPDIRTTRDPEEGSQNPVKPSTPSKDHPNTAQPQ